ncbi:hypothetical protein BASA61_004868 [Batrachochytrium salamandrivorans]|nr:hypothetical protein BASA61_004868 [Batrachochytrium salamandrivorans]
MLRLTLPPCSRRAGRRLHPPLHGSAIHVKLDRSARNIQHWQQRLYANLSPVEPPVVVPAPPTPIPILSICELGTQKCVTNSTTLLTDTFDVCIQDTVTTTAWVNLQCAEGTSCGEYPSVSNRILCN